MRRFALVLAVPLCLASLPPAASQPATKRALTHDDYDAWRSLRTAAISRDGKWAAYSVSPQVGDGELVVRSTTGGAILRYPRGSRPSFTADSRFVVFRIDPAHADQLAYEYSQLKKKPDPAAKKEKKGEAPKKVEKPFASLGILDLATGTVEIVERVKGFTVPDDGPSVVVYHLDAAPPAKKAATPAKGKEPKAGSAAATKTEPQKTPGAAKKAEPPEKKEPAAKKEPAKAGTPKKPAPKKYLRDGTTLVIRPLGRGKPTRFKGVLGYGVTRKRGFLWMDRSSKKDDPEIPRGLFAVELASGKLTTLVAGGALYRSVTTDREATRMAFLTTRDDREAEKPALAVYAWDFAEPRAERIVHHEKTAGFPAGKRVSSSGGLSFCRDGGVLMFGAEDLPEEELPDVLARYKVKLDVWHWKDPWLQPMQARQAGRLRNAPTRCVWHFDQERMVVVGRTPLELVRFLSPDGSRALATDSRPYAREISWDTTYSDVYAVNTVDGSRRKLLEKARSGFGGGPSSPSGRYLMHFDGGHWHLIDVQDGSRRNLTDGLDVSFAIETWDTPQPPSPYGLAGWTADDRSVLVYDRYDIWELAVDGSERRCITDGAGRVQKIQFRYVRLDREERHVPTDRPILLSAFDTETMASGYYTDAVSDLAKPRRIVMLDKAFQRLTKARDADRYLFTLSTFEEYPDLWTSGPDFRDPRRLSDVNPQQKSFRWGKAELVHWHSADGIPLKGILIKPEGFDPKRKYPLMIYFYERLSSRLHRYVAPAPGTTPNAAYYVSNGYLWFSPDIEYRVGYPGESCLKCVVPGVQSLIERGFVDVNAIGASGHSWGGYQTAYLVTRTDMFKAVESGAPVSNMTSAYGGIRWGSGMSREFQYERTQSRIGGSLWEYPMRYLENSPIFAADRVRTPVLMLHNDQDGAVPWYQGIEYFCALRRLGKEVYMFDYVGSGHGLGKRADLMDWTERMQQYFDHHLRGAPMPDWMKNGVPYAEREREKLEFRPPPMSPPETKKAPKPTARGWL